MKQKIEQLKMLNKSVRNARAEKNNAELSIISLAGLPLDDKCPQSCLVWVALVEGREPIYISVRCQMFKKDEGCKNKNCQAFDKNAEYAKAYENYKNAINVRREFIKGLFIRSK